MDGQPHSAPKLAHSSISGAESPSPASGMFSNSQQFTVKGQTFINITNNNHPAAPSLPADLRMIPLGDIDLRHQLRMDEYTGVVESQPCEQAYVRRVHSAKAIVASRKSSVTVAIYQGNDAEERWRQDISKYMSMRHPNIVQICGAASSNGMYAAILNDDLIPLRHFLDRYRESHFSTVYIYACCNKDFSEVNNYLKSEFQLRLYSEECTQWIRRSTGRLCTELIPATDNFWLGSDLHGAPPLSEPYNLSAGAEEIAMFIDSLTLTQYHDICTKNLAHHQWIPFSADTIMNLGAVCRCSNYLLEDLVEIAFLPSAEAFILYNWTISGGGTGENMPDGWTRYFFIGRCSSG
ncbi:hypothetical protein MSAN_02133000 [Mycena sanguinolenta]|uniref:Uncharacterized protein n=1 Tax=Mycena sanguinolenta TaxID=230812 RepID=A0A8H6XGA4_9AGAR|nr:hypothetical protein MSAN_02133000 [Mycena sanguinolenta]